MDLNQSLSKISRPPSDLVSIVIPAYNAETTIRETLESVRAQSMQRWEAIVINDGSTDRTASIVSDFAETTKQSVRQLRTENRGVSAARNLGIRAARGQYLAFLDADDVWLPTKLEQQIAKLEAFPKAIGVGCAFAKTSTDLSQVLDVIESKWSVESIHAWLLLERRGVLLPSTLVIRQAALHDIGGFNERLSTASDLEMAHRIVHFGEVHALREPLVLYRTSPGQMHRDVDLLERDYEELFRDGFFRENSANEVRARFNLRFLRVKRSLITRDYRTALQLTLTLLVLQPLRCIQVVTWRLRDKLKSAV